MFRPAVSGYNRGERTSIPVCTVSRRAVLCPEKICNCFLLPRSNRTEGVRLYVM